MKRLGRKDPTRNGPRRNFARMYAAPAGAGVNQSSSNGANKGSESRGDSSKGDAPSSIVDTAYRVIEKYVEEGRAAAQQFSRSPYTSWMTGDGMQQLVEILLRFQTEFIPIWFEAMSSVIRVGPSVAPTAPTSSTASVANGAKAVTIDLSSQRPVEVTVDLRDFGEGVEPVCLGARALSSNGPDITEIRLDASHPNTIPKVHIRVPPKQSAGHYSGVIVDRRTGNVCGTISLRIADN